MRLASRRQVVLGGVAGALLQGCGWRGVLPRTGGPVGRAVVQVDVTSGRWESLVGSGTLRDATFWSPTRTMLQPVLDAFNATQRGLRVRYVPPFLPGKGRGTVTNYQPSVILGQRVRSGNRDLAGAIRGANVNEGRFIPGVWAGVTMAGGYVPCVPVDVTVYGLRYRVTALGPATGAASTWSNARFAGRCAAALKTGATFGSGLGLAYPNSAWLGYASGHGGSVVRDGRLTLTEAAVLQGLSDYAAILEITASHSVPEGTLATFDLDPTSRTNAGMPAWRMIRFPLLPSGAVPADLLGAGVPEGAPEPQGGVRFVLWLLTRQGQLALTSVGFPAMRTDIGAGRAWYERRPLQTPPSALRFLPASWAAVPDFYLGKWVMQAVALPGPVRRDALRVVEGAVNGLLSGHLSLASASRVVAQGSASRAQ